MNDITLFSQFKANCNKVYDTIRRQFFLLFRFLLFVYFLYVFCCSFRQHLTDSHH